MKNLNLATTKLDQKHKILADKLLAIQLKESSIVSLPAYEYEQLLKGIICEACGSLAVGIEKTKCICENCGHKEKVAYAVLRSINEFRRLFPNKKITTNAIHDWCGMIESKERIRMVLQKHFKINGVHQWAFYE